MENNPTAEKKTSPKGAFDGPIPGENYTSDTRNYPWHRPPEYDNLDKAIEAAAKKLTSKEGSVGVLTMIENGMPISALTQAFIMSGIGTGKWTLDYGLLMAGPVAHIMCLMAKAYDIPYELGVDNKPRVPTKAFFDGLKEIDKKKAEAAGKEALGNMGEVNTNPETPKGGFMSMKAPGEETTPVGEEY